MGQLQLQMKKSFRDRIEVIESRLKNRQINEPTTYIDNETGLTMQVSNGLAVPAPMTVEHWVDWVDKYYQSAKQHTPPRQNQPQGIVFK